MVGGESRTYVMDIFKNTTPTLLYDDPVVSDTPFHEPIAVLNNGTVYFDQYIANAGAAWGYGISTVNFDGSNKQELSNMQNGTYGTQPILSTDGKYLAFAGYDGKDGSGASLVNGFKKALVSPDTIEILITTTNQREKLPNIANQNSYISAAPTNLGNIFYSALSKDPTEMGGHLYNPQNGESSYLTYTKNNSYTFINNLSADTTLLGKDNASDSTFGNLGNNYSQTFSEFDFAQKLKSPTRLPLNGATMQYITLAPTNYFSDNLLTTGDASNRQLQLQTFVIKPTLIPVRIESQSSVAVSSIYGGTITQPPQPTTSCGGPNQPSCQQAPPPPPPAPPQTVSHPPDCSSGISQAQCTPNVVPPGGGSPCPPSGYPACAMDPIYLYGPAGTKIHADALIPGSNDAHSADNFIPQYDITLGTNGSFFMNGQQYGSLPFYYNSPIQVVPTPKYGIFATQGNLNTTIQYFATHLGLNTQETNDLLSYVQQNLHSPYIFVSYLDNDTSKQIKPMSFNPEPDNYYNIVFYFKELGQKPDYSPILPPFTRIKRNGFSVISVSEVIQQM